MYYIKGVDHSDFSGFLLRDMGLFVLQCKHRKGELSNPGNLIESPLSLNFIFWQKWVSLSSLGHTVEIGKPNFKIVRLPVTVITGGAMQFRPLSCIFINRGLATSLNNNF